jgi:DNA-directed RNA polymerase specialized sigma24 family protein
MNNGSNRSRRPWDDWPTRNRHSPLGYVYVIAYSTGAVKVGKTLQPRARARDLRFAAAQFGVTITDAWVSRPHGEYAANEVRLHAACAALGPCWGPETFACSLHDVVAAADGLPMTNTPPAEPTNLRGAQARAAQRRAKVLELHAEGYQQREIAAELGCSVGTVHADLHR